MARYCGWNEVGVRNCDNTVDHDRRFTGAHVATSPTQTLRSFTPINTSYSNSSIHGLSKAQPRGIDGDKLFDLPDEPPAGTPASKRQKTKRTVSSRPRPSPWSSRTLTSQRSTGSGVSVLSTLTASETSSSGLPKLKQYELFSNAIIKESVAPALDQTGLKAFLNTGKVAVAKSTVEKLSAFRFQARQPSSFKAPDVGTGSCVTDSTLLVVDEEGREYDGSTSKNGRADVPSLAQNVAANFDINCHEDLHDVFEDIGLFDHRSYSLLHGDQVPNEVSDLFDSDDEFPMDFEDELEMAQLSLPGRVSNINAFNASEQPIPIGSQLQSEDSEIYYEPPSSHKVGPNSSETTLNILEDLPPPDAHSIVIDINESPYSYRRSHQGPTSMWGCQPGVGGSTRISPIEISAKKAAEYSPIPIFARPNFPSRVCDRSPIDGLSASIISPVCFRVGELIRIGGYWDSLGQDACVELFARVCSSSRVAGSSDQLFQFADIFHDRPPFPHGILKNCKAYGLQETESRQLLGPEAMGQMVRCIGQWKRVTIGAPGWMLHINNIRTTDWEEVRYLKDVAGAGMACRGQ